MTHNHPLTIRCSRAASGFSLVEVMIAMGIFAVGFVAVASMFPVSIILQKETVTQIESQLVARNASAMVRARKLTYDLPNQAGSDLDAGTADQPTGLDVVSSIAQLTPFSDITRRTLNTRWTVGDRAYPSYESNPNNRKYYWVPFLRKLKNGTGTPVPVAKVGDFQVVVFILRREYGKTYVTTAPSGGKIAYAADGAAVPRVVGVPVTASGATFTFATANGNDVGGPVGPTTADGVPDQVRTGDWVADNRGYIYLVNGATASGFTIDGSIPFAAGRTSVPEDPIAPVTTIWYAPPPTPTDVSPCTRVILLSDVVAAAP